MNPSTRTHSGRQLLTALFVLALAARPIEAAGPGLTGFVFALDEQGKITGTVPGAAIEFKGTAVVKATADKYGRYKVDMRPGAYTFTIAAAGFKDENQGHQITTKTVPNGYQVQNFSLTVGQTDPKQKPPRVPGIAGFLEGKVATGLLQGEVVEKTADGNEVPIPGATVYLRNTIGKPRLSQATTRMHDEKTKKSRQGHYELELDAGTYTASVVASGFESFKEVEPITIVAGKTTTHRFVLTRGRPPVPKRQGIEGTFTFADPGKTAATRPPVKLSIVAVGDSDKPAATFYPDDKGGFRRSLPAGRYRLVVEAKGYRTYPRTIPDVYVLRGAFAKVNVSLVPDLHFYALVYERVGQGTRPLPGASFELIRSADPSSKPRRLTTDKRGYVSLILDKEGEYVALARLAGFTAAGGVKVTVRANGNNHANIVLERSGVALSLQVVEEYAGKKTPLEGAHVTVKGEKSSWGRTSADGRYKVTGLAKGGYAVEVVRKGFKSASTKIFVSNTDLSREIVLTPDMKAFDLTIHAKADGKPVAGAQVVVNHGKASRSGSTGGAGSYRIRLAAGTFTVSVTHKGYKSASAQIVIADENITRDIVLTPVTTQSKYFELTIHAKVGGKPMAGALVAVAFDDDRVASGTTDDSGSYTAKRLAVGKYTVYVIHKGYKRESTQVVIANRNVSRDIALTPDKTPAKSFDLIVHAQAGGRPVVGAEVCVWQGDAKRMVGSTDGAGSYTARGLGAGYYTVDVIHRGYKPARSPQVILSDRNVSRDIALAQDTPPPAKPTIAYIHRTPPPGPREAEALRQPPNARPSPHEAEVLRRSPTARPGPSEAEDSRHPQKACPSPGEAEVIRYYDSAARADGEKKGTTKHTKEHEKEAGKENELNEGRRDSRVALLLFFRVLSCVS